MKNKNVQSESEMRMKILMKRNFRNAKFLETNKIASSEQAQKQTLIVFDEKKFVKAKRMQNRRRVRLKLKTKKMQYRRRAQENL